MVLGDILVAKGLVSHEDIARANEHQREIHRVTMQRDRKLDETMPRIITPADSKCALSN